VIVNRTLVYGSLTAMLALPYLGGVTLFKSPSGHSLAKRSSPNSP